MLTESEDFPQNLVYLYRNKPVDGTTFIAERLGDGTIVGMLTGTFATDLFDRRDYEDFDLPPLPHSVVERIFVPLSERRNHIGSALLSRYLEEASRRGCTFIGGALDIGPGLADRKRFFAEYGFDVTPNNFFGAPLSALR
jgi:GNAT superfamily N-acetyltransferase